MEKFEIPHHFKKCGNKYFFENSYKIIYDGQLFFFDNFCLDFCGDEIYIGGEGFDVYLKLEKVSKFQKLYI